MTCYGINLKGVQPKEEKHFIVLIPSYKNSQWYKKNLDSIFMQKYSNYHILYIDDCSPDGTGDLVEKYIKEKKQEHKVILIKNTETWCYGKCLYGCLNV